MRHHAFYRRPEEAVVAGDDAPLALERRSCVRRGRDPDDAAAIAKRQSAVAQAEAVHGIDETRRPAAAVELAVGDRGQAERLLERDDFPDALVLHLFELVFSQFFFLVGARSLQQPLGPHEAADVLDVKRRLHRAPPNSARRSLAPSTIAVILPDATSRGRHFMPQSGATITSSGFTYFKAFLTRSATFPGVSMLASES